jgi:hypothetical protein
MTTKPEKGNPEWIWASISQQIMSSANPPATAVSVWREFHTSLCQTRMIFCSTSANIADFLRTKLTSTFLMRECMHHMEVSSAVLPSPRGRGCTCGDVAIPSMHVCVFLYICHVTKSPHLQGIECSTAACQHAHCHSHIYSILMSVVVFFVFSQTNS